MMMDGDDGDDDDGNGLLVLSSGWIFNADSIGLCFAVQMF